MEAEGQAELFDTGLPLRRAPTREEIDAALTAMVKLAVWKRHRGRPPRGMDWSDLYQEVSYRALKRIGGFRHGGRFSLNEYTYMAACYSLTDIHRENMRSRPPGGDSTFSQPLFDAV